MFDLGTCKLVFRTARAGLVKQVNPPKCDDVGEVWVPWSVIGDDSEITQRSRSGDVGLVFVEEWFATERKWL
jgi:hypothetical protein